MGIYLNPGSGLFEEALRSEIYVDKTGMIRYLNTLVMTSQKYVCVSRPRRFGKSMAASMVCAYYGRGAKSRGLFEGRALAQDTFSGGEEPGLSWDAYLGQFDVIRLVMTDFIRSGIPIERALEKLQKLVVRDLARSYPDVDYCDRDDMLQVMQDVYAETERRFVIVIDEWDAIFREHAEDREGQKRYLDFLRDWLKDREYVALAYMTGILPIKKYGKHSALNMFDEYSMIFPMQLAQYTGFTEDEVRALCERYGRPYEDVKQWYDGYRVSDIVPPDPHHEARRATGAAVRAEKYALYSPLSVVKAMRSGIIDNYWNQTETYEALRQYIDWDFDGLKEDVAILMKGGRVSVNITGYQNDMTTFHNKDDILTMLIHLGYLGYDSERGELFIPNREVLQVFDTSTRDRSWTATFRALENSRKLLEATWAGDAETVAALIERAHDCAGNRTYHSEAGLSYAVQLAYYSAQDEYTLIPELDTGKGYADLAYLPKRPGIPALLIGLKYDEDADSAIRQIHRQRYPDRLEHYRGNLVLVGIGYEREASNEGPRYKHHSCVIERA